MKIIDEFKKFALRGNLVELAIGFTVGAAFTSVAKSLVSDILMPPIGLILGRVDFTDLFLVLSEGAQTAGPYVSLAEAQKAGAVTINFGVFFENVFSLVIVAIAMFALVRSFNRIDDALEERTGKKQSKEAPANKKCPRCMTTIASRATRCPACTSELEESEA